MTELPASEVLNDADQLARGWTGTTGQPAPKLKLVITRRPPPPPLPSFDCVVCEEVTERDPYRPDLEAPPVCFRCLINTPTRPRMTGIGVADWADFRRVHAVLCAIDEEIKRVRRAH